MLFVSLIIQLTLFSHQASATPQSLNYQGRILQSNGNPLNSADVDFRFTVTSQDGACILYQDQVDGINMQNSGGIFDLSVGGSNAVQFLAPQANGSFSQVFQNNLSFTCGVCSTVGNGQTCTDFGGATYSPSVNDIRRLRVQFNDGTGWKLITPDNEIRAVPYAFVAHQAEKIGSLSESVLLTRALAPVCVTANSFLQWNGTDFDCVSVSALVAADIPNIDASKISSGTITNTVVNTSTTSTNGSFGTASISSLRLFDGTSEYLSHSYPSGGTGYTITWPANQGAVSTVLQNDGSGNLSWVSLPSSPVTSVAGRTGAVVLSNTDISGLGTAATHNVAAVGDAATSEIVKGNDTRLTNGRIPIGSAGGDLSGNYPTPTVAQIQGRPVSSAAPVAAGQALLWDGSEWHANYIRAQDLRNSWGGDQMIPSSSCLANQAMVWSSITDRFVCRNISNLDASAIDTGTISPGRLGSGTANSTTFLRGDGVWSTLSVDPNTILNGGNTFGSDITVGTNDNQALRLETNNLTRMSVLSNGNVGIGTLNPLVNLDVRSSGQTVVLSGGNGAGSYGSFIGSSSRGSDELPSSTQLNDNLAVFGAVGFGSTTYPSATRVGIGMQASEDWTDSSQGTSMYFFTTPNGTSFSQDRMAILNNGNIGIGTNSPSSKLSVESTSAATSGDSNGVNVLMTANPNSATTSNYTAGKFRSEFAVNQTTSSKIRGIYSEAVKTQGGTSGGYLIGFDNLTQLTGGHQLLFLV